MDVIERAYIDNKNLHEYLISVKEVSYANVHSAQSAKNLLLSCASHFEVKMISIIKDAMDAKECVLRDQFVYNQALLQKYHSLFNWKQKKANDFFSKFGSNFTIFMQAKLKEKPLLEQSIEDFLELGKLRNYLVHNDFLSYQLPLTDEEVFNKYKSALHFTEALPAFFQEFKATMNSNRSVDTEDG
ncbi:MULTISPECIES: HEPN domain-containing protein [unclassified Providencia]|nr:MULTISPECIES: HEPN domain-containing protein [unclassified Providencia]